MTSAVNRAGGRGASQLLHEINTRNRSIKVLRHDDPLVFWTDGNARPSRLHGLGGFPGGAVCGGRLYASVDPDLAWQAAGDERAEGVDACKEVLPGRASPGSNRLDARGVRVLGYRSGARRRKRVRRDGGGYVRSCGAPLLGARRDRLVGGRGEHIRWDGEPVHIPPVAGEHGGCVAPRVGRHARALWAETRPRGSRGTSRRGGGLHGRAVHEQRPTHEAGDLVLSLPRAPCISVLP